MDLLCLINFIGQWTYIALFFANKALTQRFTEEDFAVTLSSDYEWNREKTQIPIVQKFSPNQPVERRILVRKYRPPKSARTSVPATAVPEIVREPPSSRKIGKIERSIEDSPENPKSLLVIRYSRARKFRTRRNRVEITSTEPPTTLGNGSNDFAPRAQETLNDSEDLSGSPDEIPTEQAPSIGGDVESSEMTTIEMTTAKSTTSVAFTTTGQRKNKKPMTRGRRRKKGRKGKGRKGKGLRKKLVVPNKMRVLEALRDGRVDDPELMYRQAEEGENVCDLLFQALFFLEGSPKQKILKRDPVLKQTLVNCESGNVPDSPPLVEARDNREIPPLLRERIEGAGGSPEKLFEKHQSGQSICGDIENLFGPGALERLPREWIEEYPIVADVVNRCK